MKLKNPLSFGSFAFYIGEGEDIIRIPETGYSRSKNQVVNGIIAMFEQLASQGEPGYKDRAMAEAKKMNLDYKTYISLLLEHQICLRAGGIKSGICQNSGIGDKIHSFVAKIDSVIEKAPDIIKKPIKKLVGSTLLKKESSEVRRAGRASGCGGCGGTVRFTKKAWNFGRAGRMDNRGK